MERHDLRLAGRIRDEALSAGLEVFAEGSSIVTIKTGLDYQAEERLYEKLVAEGISVSHRGVLGHYGIRASPHLYNTKDDVETFLEALFGAMETGL